MSVIYRGIGKRFRILIDDDVLHELKREKLYISVKSNNNRVIIKKYTKGRRPSGTVIFKEKSLSRYIMRPPKEKQVDHINGNTLDNRRKNLRLCSASQNGANRKTTAKENRTSAYRGVHYCKHAKFWFASVYKNRRLVYRQKFISEKDAANDYNKNARHIHGEFFRPNNIEAGKL